MKGFCRIGIVFTTLIAITGGAQSARATVVAHLEGGFGFADEQPLEARTTPGATASLGASVPVKGTLRAGIELTATVGGEWGVDYIETTPRAGDRSMTTFLAGVEACREKGGRGFYVGVGAGIGHATLSGATGGWDYVTPVVRHERNFVGPAFGIGLGYRTHGGPGPLGFLIGGRYHTVVHGHVNAAAFALTTGLAY